MLLDSYSWFLIELNLLGWVCISEATPGHPTLNIQTSPDEVFAQLLAFYSLLQSTT